MVKVRMEESSSSEFQCLQRRGLPRRNRRQNQCGRWGLGWVGELGRRNRSAMRELAGELRDEGDEGAGRREREEKKLRKKEKKLRKKEEREKPDRERERK